LSGLGDTTQPLGPRTFVRIAKQWGDAPVRAVIVLRRGDWLALKLDLVGSSPRIFLGKELSRRAEGETAMLPDPMMLVLDDRDVLHLVGLRQGFPFLRAGEELMQWPVGAVRVTSRHGRGKKFLRIVEISYGDVTLSLLAPGRAPRQRAALELIERLTGAGTSTLTTP
jgi:hypothetical protein